MSCRGCNRHLGWRFTSNSFSDNNDNDDYNGNVPLILGEGRYDREIKELRKQWPLARMAYATTRRSVSEQLNGAGQTLFGIYRRTLLAAAQRERKSYREREDGTWAASASASASGSGSGSGSGNRSERRSVASEREEGEEEEEEEEEEDGEEENDDCTENYDNDDEGNESKFKGP